MAHSYSSLAHPCMLNTANNICGAFCYCVVFSCTLCHPILFFENDIVCTIIASSLSLSLRGRRAWYTPTVHMCKIIRKFSVKSSTYYSLPCCILIARSNRRQGKYLCFCWPANRSNKLFELPLCICRPYASRRDK